MFDHTVMCNDNMDDDDDQINLQCISEKDF